MDKKPLKILAVGRNREILEVVLRLINNRPEWTGRGAASPEEALSLCAEEPFDLLLLCAGITPEEESAITRGLGESPAPPKILRHYGGGSGLLLSEILQANHQNHLS